MTRPPQRPEEHPSGTEPPPDTESRSAADPDRPRGEGASSDTEARSASRADDGTEPDREDDEPPPGSTSRLSQLLRELNQHSSDPRWMW